MVQELIEHYCRISSGALQCSQADHLEINEMIKQNAQLVQWLPEAAGSIRYHIDCKLKYRFRL